MYSISSATHITTTKDFNQSFFPELSAGANVVVSGSGIGTGVYSRSSDRGELTARFLSEWVLSKCSGLTRIHVCSKLLG